MGVDIFIDWSKILYNKSAINNQNKIMENNWKKFN